MTEAVIVGFDLGTSGMKAVAINHAAKFLPGPVQSTSPIAPKVAHRNKTHWIGLQPPKK